MSGNSIGKLFTVTSFGESHGPAIGCMSWMAALRELRSRLLIYSRI